MKVPFLSLSYQNDQIKEQALHSIKKIMDRDWYIMGESLSQFEKEYAHFNQVDFCTGVGNGLDAIRIALMALEIGEGDEVIVPSNTFIATWIAVSNVDARIVPVEPDENSFNISPINIQKAITKKTKAIIPVHLYGQACLMTEIQKIAEENNLFVIEDNAQAQGAMCDGRQTGSFGALNTTSFYPGKNLGAMGDGGAITSDNKHLIKKVNAIRNYGSSEKYVHNLVGLNSRLDEMQAAILSLKLEHLKGWTTERVELANKYADLLMSIPEIQLPFLEKNCTHVYHLYVIKTDRRDELQVFLAEKGVSTLIHYPNPSHLQKAYENLNYRLGDFPVAEKLSKTILSLPLYPGLKDEQIEYVCEQIKDFFK